MTTRQPVLILTYVYPPDSEIGAWRAYRFSKYLSRLGHPVQVLSSTTGTKPEEQGNIFRIPGKIPGDPRKLAIYTDLALRLMIFYDAGIVWVPGATRYAARWMKETPQPVVISTSPPIHTHLAAWWLKKRYGVRWIADFRDPMRDNLRRKVSRSRHFDPFFERRIIGGADVVIANTDPVLALWKERYPEFAHKIRVLPNGFDPEDFQTIPALPPRNGKLITHVGSVYAGRDPMYMLRAVHRLIGKGRLAPDQLRIAFYGDMPPSILSEEIFQRLMETGCVSHDPPQPDKQKSEQIMRDSDVLLMLDFMDRSRLQVPAKVYFYVRTGRAVIACTRLESPTEHILEKSGIPYVCLHPEDSEEQLDMGVLKAASFPSGYHEPSSWFLDTYDASLQAIPLSKWIEETADR
ncbi:MAG: glycosyltransferase [Bryobacterales bacterium]|nr:glycosyltransferase [Bryobacterales bacterium]